MPSAITDPDEIAALLDHAIEQQEVICVLYAHEGKGSARLIVPSNRFISGAGDDCVRAYDSIHRSTRTFRIERIKQAHLIAPDMILS